MDIVDVFAVLLKVLESLPILEVLTVPRFLSCDGVREACEGRSIVLMRDEA